MAGGRAFSTQEVDELYGNVKLGGHDIYTSDELDRVFVAERDARRNAGVRNEEVPRESPQALSTARHGMRYESLRLKHELGEKMFGSKRVAMTPVPGGLGPEDFNAWNSHHFVVRDVYGSTGQVRARIASPSDRRAFYIRYVTENLMVTVWMDPSPHPTFAAPICHYCKQGTANGRIVHGCGTGECQPARHQPKCRLVICAPCIIKRAWESRQLSKTPLCPSCRTHFCERDIQAIKVRPGQTWG